MALSFKEMTAGTISDNVDFVPLHVTMCFSAAAILAIGALICLFRKPAPLQEGDTLKKLPLALALGIAPFPVALLNLYVVMPVALIAMFAGFILLSRYLSRCGASLSKHYATAPPRLMFMLPALAVAAILAALPYIHFALTR